MKAFAFVVVVMISTPVFADDFERAVAAQESGDHSAAASLFRSLAQQGNSKAQVKLGNMYFVGQGVKQNGAYFRPHPARSGSQCAVAEG